MPLGPGCIGPPQSPQTTRRSASTGRDGHGTRARSLRRRPPVIFRRSPGTCPCPRRSVHSARRQNGGSRPYRARSALPSELSFDKTLIEPICQASLIGWHDKEDSARARILFSNPASQTKRHRLTVRSSSDEGKTWAFSKVLNEGSSSYSSLDQLDDGSIGCLYESGYGRIVFARF